MKFQKPKNDQVSQDQDSSASTSQPRNKKPNLNAVQSAKDGPNGRLPFPVVDPSRVVRRPIPSGEVKPGIRRANEIAQLKRRWGANFREVNGAEGQYELTLKQSEEFPYDLDALHVTLSIPSDYPSGVMEKPGITVLNDDIPLGHQLNIQRGFDSLVSNASTDTRLLDLLNSLDNKLEFFLGAEKAATITIVPNRNLEQSSTAIEDVASALREASIQETVSYIMLSPTKIVPSFTDEERTAAKKRRDVETRQLEARFRQSAIFYKAGDDVNYTVPLEPRRRNLLPTDMQTLRSVQLNVPLLYPLEPCEVVLRNMQSDTLAKNVSSNFMLHCQENQDATLMAHLNYLAQHIHTMIQSSDDAEVAEQEVPVESSLAIIEPLSKAERDKKPVSQDAMQDDRSHIQFITRPPEWDFCSDDSDTDSEFELESEGSQPDDAQKTKINEEMSQEVVQEKNELTTVERGTSISFPGIQFRGIEVLEMKIVNMTVKCSRCKTLIDIHKIKARENKFSKAKLLGCDKCSNVLGIGIFYDCPLIV